MESMDITPDHFCDSYSAKGNETEPETSESPSETSTKSDDLHTFPAGIKTLYYSQDSSADNIGFEWDNEDPAHPFRFLDLPLEIQLEVIVILSESYETHDLIPFTHPHRHPLLDLRR